MNAGRSVGTYVLKERLGQGGMGMVWRAHDAALERDVAIKMILPPGDPTHAREVAVRFLVEAKAAAAIKSRHVAQVLQLGTTDEGEVYIVMELLEGSTLLTLLLRERTLPAPRAVRIACQIARGLEAAHALGIVHRDLKPANVMLVRADGEDEVVKVLDFGVAKRTRSADEALTEKGGLYGTLHFMAPEQIAGLPVDARSDVYSLGVLLYRMLAGRVPNDSDNMAELARMIVDVPARSLGGGFSPALDAVVLRALAKRPDDRFPTMAAFEAALAGLDLAAHTTARWAVDPAPPRPVSGDFAKTGALEGALPPPGAGELAGTGAIDAAAMPSPALLPRAMTPFPRASVALPGALAEVVGSDDTVRRFERQLRRRVVAVAVGAVVALVLGGIVLVASAAHEVPAPPRMPVAAAPPVAVAPTGPPAEAPDEVLPEEAAATPAVPTTVPKKRAKPKAGDGFVHVRTKATP